jgi:predicted mannosyl-3-phosphoglycerate phosphatase (HAD superfamily)
MTTGEVVSRPGLWPPYKVVLLIGDEKHEIPVFSEAEGEALIVKTLQGLRTLPKGTGDP